MFDGTVCQPGEHGGVGFTEGEVFCGEGTVGGFVVGESVEAGCSAVTKVLLEVLVREVMPVAELKLTSEVKDA